MTQQVIEPTSFDLVVVGTGLVESLLAAAAAKIGKQVLQIDSNEHYGGLEATLPLEEAVQFLKQNNTVISDVIELGEPPASAMNTAGSAAFQFDLSPKLMYAAGPMLTFLLQSGAHHYMEFKLVEGRYIHDDGFAPLAASRAEIFKDPTLTVIQKHSMMQALKAIMAQQDSKGAQTDLKALLHGFSCEQDLQDRLIHGVLLSQGEDQMTVGDAKALVELYAASCGRFGPDSSPFLYPLYGCGEYVQAFCRTAAVNGAIQCLRCKWTDITLGPSEDCCIHLGNGQSLRSKKIVAGPQWLGHRLKCHVQSNISHCIAVLEGNVFPKKGLAFGVLPRSNGQGDPVWMMQTDDSTYHCPSGYSVLHLWSNPSRVESSDGGDDSLVENINIRGTTTASSLSTTATKSSGLPGECLARNMKIILSRLADCSRLDGMGTESLVSQARVVYAIFYGETILSNRMEDQSLTANLTLPRVFGASPTLLNVCHEAKRCFEELYSERFPFDSLPTLTAEEQYDSDDDMINSLENALQAKE